MSRFVSAWLIGVMISTAAPVAAQLLELPEPRAEPSPARQKPPPKRSKPAPEKTAEPEAKAPEAPPPEPPDSLARPVRPPVPTPPVEAPAERSPLIAMLLALLGIGITLMAVQRARGWMSANVAVHRTLGAVVLLLRLAGLGVALGIILELVPEGQDWILWSLVALALVIGWSIRDLFADIIAGAVLAAERRVRKGVWVSGEGFQGTVEGRTLRATWLRDGQGHRLTVPNRAMVGAPMVYDAGVDAEHEVVVRLEGYQDASKVRMALTDAILSSPWVLAGANPVVLRDPADPVVWRVRTKLLEPRFSVHFEGELLERVEDLLRYDPDEEDTSPGTTEAPPPSRTSGNPVA